MPVVGERWEVYALPDGDGRRVVSFDVDALDEATRPASASRRVVLEIPEEMRGPNGMPAPGAAVPMRLAEEALLDALAAGSVACRLVARRTLRGVRELAFQVEDGLAFEKTAADWRRVQRWTTRIDADEGWAWFDANVRPPEEAWDQIRNRAIINALVEDGTDPEAPHRLEHYFAGPKASLDALAAALEPLGFERIAADQGRAIFVAEGMLDVLEITEMTTRMRALASEHEAEYSGWKATVVPLPACP